MPKDTLNPCCRAHFIQQRLPGTKSNFSAGNTNLSCRQHYEKTSVGNAHCRQPTMVKFPRRDVPISIMSPYLSPFSLQPCCLSQQLVRRRAQPGLRVHVGLDEAAHIFFFFINLYFCRFQFSFTCCIANPRGEALSVPLISQLVLHNKSVSYFVTKPENKKPK